MASFEQVKTKYESLFRIMQSEGVGVRNLHLEGGRLFIKAETLYAHPIHFLETFVDKERFRGTCYRAANWIFLGETTGRGKDDQTHRPNRSIKQVLGYPLMPCFRQLLQQS